MCIYTVTVLVKYTFSSGAFQTWYEHCGENWKHTVPRTIIIDIVLYYCSMIFSQI